MPIRGPQLRISPLTKTALGEAVANLIRGANQYVTAIRLGVTQPRIAALNARQFSLFSFERLLIFATRLGHDVEIVVKPAPTLAHKRPRQGSIHFVDQTDHRAV